MSTLTLDDFNFGSREKSRYPHLTVQHCVAFEDATDFSITNGERGQPENMKKLRN